MKYQIKFSNNKYFSKKFVYYFAELPQRIGVNCPKNIPLPYTHYSFCVNWPKNILLM